MILSEGQWRTQGGKLWVRTPLPFLCPQLETKDSINYGKNIFFLQGFHIILGSHHEKIQGALLSWVANYIF